MNCIIEQIAIDKGIAINDINDILIGFSYPLLSKVPELKEVIENIVVDEEPGKLKEHINKMVILLQDKKADVFKTWTMPKETNIFRRSGNGPLF
jgi:hypothetical protein